MATAPQLQTPGLDDPIERWGRQNGVRGGAADWPGRSTFNEALKSAGIDPLREAPSGMRAGSAPAAAPVAPAAAPKYTPPPVDAEGRYKYGGVGNGQTSNSLGVGAAAPNADGVPGSGVGGAVNNSGLRSIEPSGVTPEPKGLWGRTKGLASGAYQGVSRAVSGTYGAAKTVGPGLAAGAAGSYLAGQAREYDPTTGTRGGYTPPSAVNQIPTDGYGPAPDKQAYNYFTDNETGRNIGNLAMATAPLGGMLGSGMRSVPTAGKLIPRLAYGADMVDAATVGAANNIQRGREETAAPTNTTPYAINKLAPNQTVPTSQRTGLRLNDQQRMPMQQDPRLLNANTSRPELGQSRDFTNELSGRPGGNLPQLPADLREGVIHKTIDAQGRVTYSGRNVGTPGGGSVQMVDGMGKGLRNQGSVEMAAPGSFSSGSGGYAFTPSAATAEGRGLQKQEWDAKVAGPKKDPYGINVANLSNEQRITLRNQDMDNERAMAPLRLQAKMREYSAQILASAGGDTVKATQLALRSGFPEIAKQFQDAHTSTLANESSAQSLGHAAETNARTALKQYGPGKDGLQVEDPGKSAAMYDTASQIIPGFTQMNEGARNHALAQSKDLLDLFGKLQGQNQMGIDKVNPFELKKPGLTGLPNLAKGKTSQASGLRGPLTPGVSNGDYFTTYADGRQVPLGNLNSRQLHMLELAHKGVPWADILRETQGAE